MTNGYSKPRQAAIHGRQTGGDVAYPTVFDTLCRSRFRLWHAHGKSAREGGELIRGSAMAPPARHGTKNYDLDWGGTSMAATVPLLRQGEDRRQGTAI
jgi:hypothetical protein